MTRNRRRQLDNQREEGRSRTQHQTQILHKTEQEVMHRVTTKHSTEETKDK